MKILDKKIELPSVLHDLHGKETSIFDLIITYLSGIVITSIILYDSYHLLSDFLRIVVLIFLSLDIAGGVVSNFTQGTSENYAQSKFKRLLFISIHFLQPLGLFWVFQNDGIAILITTFLTLLGSLIINSIENINRKITYGCFLMTAITSLTFYLNFKISELHLLMILYTIKLVFAFPINWYKTNIIQ